MIDWNFLKQYPPCTPIVPMHIYEGAANSVDWKQARRVDSSQQQKSNKQPVLFKKILAGFKLADLEPTLIIITLFSHNGNSDVFPRSPDRFGLTPWEISQKTIQYKLLFSSRDISAQGFRRSLFAEFISGWSAFLGRGNFWLLFLLSFDLLKLFLGHVIGKC